MRPASGLSFWPRVRLTSVAKKSCGGRPRRPHLNNERKGGPAPVFRRDMIFFPDSRSESSRRSHLPTTSHNYAACEQDSWILITLVLTSYCERTLRGLAVIDDSNRGWPTFAGLAKLGTYAVCVEAFIWPRPSD